MMADASFPPFSGLARFCGRRRLPKRSFPPGLALKEKRQTFFFPPVVTGCVGETSGGFAHPVRHTTRGALPSCCGFLPPSPDAAPFTLVSLSDAQRLFRLIRFQRGAWVSTRRSYLYPETFFSL